MQEQRVKFEVGQVWVSNTMKVKITRIILGRTSRCIVSYLEDGKWGDWSDENNTFGYVDGIGIATINGNWKLESSTPKEALLDFPKIKGEFEKSDLDFFKQVQPGNCPCNIPKISCSYHN
jgi:hypothetical protein